jgi:hypothetical protein
VARQEVYSSADSEDLLALDEALGLLAAEDGQKAELVKLRYYAGLSVEEAARHWAYARAWLYDRLRAGDESTSGGKNANG